jgi:hypothetical protein
MCMGLTLPGSKCFSPSLQDAFHQPFEDYIDRFSMIAFRICLVMESPCIWSDDLVFIHQTTISCQSAVLKARRKINYGQRWCALACSGIPLRLPSSLSKELHQGTCRVGWRLAYQSETLLTRLVALVKSTARAFLRWLAPGVRVPYCGQEP